MDPARAAALARERPASRRARPVAARRGAGFSLFDLLVTLAAIGIVAALGVPELFRATEQTRLGLGFRNERGAVVGRAPPAVQGEGRRSR